MKNLLSSIPALVFVLFIPFMASTQNWTAEQQEVIEHIKSCNDAWSEAFEDKNYDTWAEVCPCDENAANWWVNSGYPEIGEESHKRRLSLGLIPFKKITWMDVAPLSVKIDGDVALVHFYIKFRLEDYEGKMFTDEHKRFNVYRKRDGQWTFIGGMNALERK